eukprot:355996-Lingulodinium_polyedra.AAC.1
MLGQHAITGRPCRWVAVRRRYSVLRTMWPLPGVTLLRTLLDSGDATCLLALAFISALGVMLW